MHSLLRRPLEGAWSLVYSEELLSYLRDGASLGNDGQTWSFFGPQELGVDALEEGKQFHVSMLHVPFGPWQRTGPSSQRDV
jgi:hypothetical protein